MPLTKSARSLHDISLCCIQEYLLKVGKKIIRKYGSYSIELCKSDVQSAQEFLCSILPPVVLDNILSTFINTKIKLSEIPIPCSPMVPRLSELEAAWLVVLDVLMHPNMKVFWPPFYSHTVPLFYEFKLTTMTKLVALNLFRHTTDEILSIVGMHCPLLEKIDITSKLTVSSNLVPKVFVTDKGLDCLHSCKKLKEILLRDFMLILTDSSGKNVTREGMTRLLQHLPFLDLIKYNNVGLALDPLPEGSSTLKLVELEDESPLPTHTDLYNPCTPRTVPTQESPFGWDRMHYGQWERRRCRPKIMNFRKNLGYVSSDVQPNPYLNSMPYSLKMKGCSYLKGEYHRYLSLKSYFLGVISVTSGEALPQFNRVYYKLTSTF